MIQIESRRYVSPCPPTHGKEEVARGMMWQAVERTRGNPAAATCLMGMTYTSFLYRLEKHGMAGESWSAVAQSPEMGS